MNIGMIIREHRLEKKLTQEQMARRLGVSAPAVNKWEKGNSMPDINLLSPIARLLDISLDTLLSHDDSLSDDQANVLLAQAHESLKRDDFDTVFQWAKGKLQIYPNCDYLALYMARILHSHVLVQGMGLYDKYIAFFIDCYRQALTSENERLKTDAADALYYHYMSCDEYAKAAQCLEYFFEGDPQKKRKLAAIYCETGRKEEAMRMYEELLFSGYQNINQTLQAVYALALKDDDLEKARQMTEKMSLLARLFEMGEYHEISSGLELAIIEKDVQRLYYIISRLLTNTRSISDFTKSPLYSHMSLKQPTEEYYHEIRQSILACLDSDRCDFAREDERFEAFRGE